MDKVNIAKKLAAFDAQWTPHEIARLDGYQIKLAKIEGDFVWHSHADEDELFFVLDGRFRMDYRDRQEWVEAGELVVVPKGVEHKPYAEAECSIMLIEKASADHTGGVDDPRRQETAKRI